jgi:hypothetical protein
LIGNGGKKYPQGLWIINDCSPYFISFVIQAMLRGHVMHQDANSECLIVAFQEVKGGK